MTQSQLNRAIARATGEDFQVIGRLGFSLVEDEYPLDDGDFDDLVLDWDRIQAERATALFRDRQPTEAA